MNLFEQLVEMDRTEEKDEVLCRGTDRFKKAVGSGVGREEEHFAIRGLASHSLCELQAGARRDFDITNQQVWGASE